MLEGLLDRQRTSRVHFANGNRKVTCSRSGATHVDRRVGRDLPRTGAQFVEQCPGTVGHVSPIPIPIKRRTLGSRRQGPFGPASSASLKDPPYVLTPRRTTS